MHTQIYGWISVVSHVEKAHGLAMLYSPFVTHRFILAGKPGSGWKESTANPGNLSKLKNASKTPQTFWFTGERGWPGSPSTINKTRGCLQGLYLFSSMCIWVRGLNDIEII